MTTIYDALKERLGREPTTTEILAEMSRIKTEALEDAAARGKLHWQRKPRRRTRA